MLCIILAYVQCHVCILQITVSAYCLLSDLFLTKVPSVWQYANQDKQEGVNFDSTVFDHSSDTIEGISEQESFQNEGDSKSNATSTNITTTGHSKVCY